MYYEDVKIKAGDTIWKLTGKYSNISITWKTFWQDQKNDLIRKKRVVPEKIQPGDIFNLPIPWVFTSKSVVKNPSGTAVTCKVSRDGQRGTQIRWVQTVDQDNQPIGSTSQKCVDACPPDDADPFYWTTAELIANPSLRNTFSDTPRRFPPTTAMGTTKWRAVLSIVVVTEQRVTILRSIYWGFDITSSGIVSSINPRVATNIEINNHIVLLKNGVGTGGKFSSAGWTFRRGTP